MFEGVTDEELAQAIKSKKKIKSTQRDGGYDWQIAWLNQDVNPQDYRVGHRDSWVVPVNHQEPGTHMRSGNTSERRDYINRGDTWELV